MPLKIAADDQIGLKVEAYAHWLAHRTEPIAEVMTGLFARNFEKIALDSAGLRARGWDDGLPGDRDVTGEKPLLIGGYGEARAIYKGPAFAPVNGDEARIIHLGLDLFSSAGTPVFAPLTGWVHSFQDNANPKDYGPTLILAHTITSKLTFYTLYGHLSRESIEDLTVGQSIATGQQVATLGAASVNGDWPPHLHFQIILDSLGKRGDFPGVCKKSEQEYWLQLCPDPMFLLTLV